MSYAPGLYFYQSDIDEFIKTKAAANTMVSYMLHAAGIPMEEVGRFYVAGRLRHPYEQRSRRQYRSVSGYGTGPDCLSRERFPGGRPASATETEMCSGKTGQILELMQYVQFGAVENFLELMRAASVFPHMDLKLYPSVVRKLEEKKKEAV